MSRRRESLEALKTLRIEKSNFNTVKEPEGGVENVRDVSLAS